MDGKTISIPKYNDRVIRVFVSSTFRDMHAEREELVKEMVGEMVNIIAGNASTTLENYRINISVPFVIQGSNHAVTWPHKAPIISIPFSTPFGPFEVNVSMIEK